MREFHSSDSELNKTPFNTPVHEVLPDVIRNWSIPDDEIWWSQSYQQVFGKAGLFSNSGKSWFDHIHPDDKSRVRASLMKTFDFQQAEWTATYKMKNADNSFLDIQEMAHISYRDNKPAQLTGFMKVSQSATASTLTEMRQIASIALEASGSGSFTLVLENNSLVYSPSFSGILTGVNNYPATRQIFMEHIHPDDIAIRQDAYRVGEISGILTYEARFVWKDGTVHWIKVLAKYIYNTLGKPISITGVATDISEQVEKKRALELAQEKFSFAFENAPVGMAFIDSDGVIAASMMLLQRF